MPEPYSAEHGEITQDILGRALDEMIAAGVGGVEACHAAACMAMEMLPAFACRECLARQYNFMAQALDDRIEGIPDLVPGRDVAVGPCDSH